MKKTESRTVRGLYFLCLFIGMFLFSACPQDPGVPASSPPPSPEGLAAESGDGKLYVSWRPAAGAAEYRVYCGTTETPPAEPALTTSAVSAVIPGLDNGQEYTVWVKAANAAGESGFSLSATGTPAVRQIPQQYTDFASVPGRIVTGSDTYAFDVTVPTEPPGYNGAGTTTTRKGVFTAGRTVTIGGFDMAKYETTQDLWFTVQDWALGHGYYFQNKKNNAPGAGNKNKPVTGITWRDAVVWCNAYSEMMEKEPVYRDASGAVLRDSRNANAAVCDGAVMDKTKSGYRLPTEAEREFAARGGDPALQDWTFRYAGSDNADEVAWYHGNSAFQTQTVGTKQANRLDIYDLSGNVQEWGWDWMNYAVDVTPETPLDGAAYSAAAPLANQKPFNGGGVGSNVTLSCVTYRWGFTPDYRDNSIGFRVVCNTP
jgi:formylglycine-generating enzyme required for sulfatase activity